MERAETPCEVKSNLLDESAKAHPAPLQAPITSKAAKRNVQAQTTTSRIKRGERYRPRKCLALTPGWGAFTVDIPSRD